MSIDLLKHHSLISKLFYRESPRRSQTLYLGTRSSEQRLALMTNIFNNAGRSYLNKTLMMTIPLIA